nr:unnamed protein product [Leishmania braziliensis]
MFFAGGTFGVESEARDAHRRPTGRRHQARDMAELQANIEASRGAPTVPAEGARHATAQNKMAAGPSFLDRIHEQNSIVVESPHPTRRRGAAPADHLNIFSWHDTTPAPRAPNQGHQVTASGSRTAQPTNVTAAAPTAEDRREQAAKKFEMHSDSAFLRFINAPKTGSGAEAGKRGAYTGAVSGQPVVPPPPGRDMGSRMHELSHGRRRGRGKAVAHTGNQCSVPEESGIAGFPGMGQRSTPHAVPHLTRKSAQADVLPSSVSKLAQREDTGRGDDARVPPAQAPAPKPKCIPPYHIDEDSCEDHHYMNAYEAKANGRQPCSEEMWMCDDNDYDGYDEAHTGGPTAGALHHAQGGHNPEWLHDAADRGKTGGPIAISPSVQPRQYNFDAEEQQFYEARVPPQAELPHH